MSDVTQILSQIENGDARAAEQLLEVVYAELRRLAARKLAHEKPGQTLDATGLVHEAYMRLFDGQHDGELQHWDNRGHFFAAAAEAMRRILIDRARSKKSQKRGGQRQRVELAVDLPLFDSPCDDLDDLLELDSALTRLEECDAEKAQLVKLLYFAGLNLEEAAAIQGISRTTAYRRWQFARAWLHDAISGDGTE